MTLPDELRALIDAVEKAEAKRREFEMLLAIESTVPVDNIQEYLKIVASIHRN